MIKNNKKAFTLSETLIVLTVLGVISAIVIPQVVIRYQESMNRMKIKKAMTVYDTAIAKMTFENDLKSQNALETWAKKENNTCDNAVEYFKTSDRDKCVFRTSDGVWWDISDIMQPIVAVSENDLKTAQTDGTDGKKSFKFATSFDSMLGTFRVNDLIFEKKSADEDNTAEIQNKIAELKKVYEFVAKPSSKSNQGSNHYIGNDFFTNLFGEDIEYQYDEQGRVVSFSIGYPPRPVVGTSHTVNNSEYTISYNTDNSFTITKSNNWNNGKSSDHSIESDITVSNYDKSGNKTNTIGTKIIRYRNPERYVKTVTTYDANDNVVSEINYDENDNVIED